VFSSEPNWLRLPETWNLSMVTGVATDSSGCVYVAHRGSHPLLKFDRDGNYLASIGEGDILPSVYYKLNVDPPIAMGRRFWIHGLTVDTSDNIWITDVGRHLVMKFSPDGNLVMTLGTPDVSGAGPRLFNQPTNVLIAPSGDIYVTDGYGNSRVVRFSPAGEHVLSWGKRGTGPGEFVIPHAITIDGRGRIYVAERGNGRIQVFMENGDFIAEWPGLGGIDAVLIWNGYVYAAAGLDSRILKLDLDGRLLDSWGSKEVFRFPHGLCKDDMSTFYVADILGNRATRLCVEAAAKMESAAGMPRVK
jgi:DNA-binding beta-propeller fold protein YncE